MTRVAGKGKKIVPGSAPVPHTCCANAMPRCAQSALSEGLFFRHGDELHINQILATLNKQPVVEPLEEAPQRLVTLSIPWWSSLKRHH
ncbi:hypothetical protein Prudu_006743, partial [Prunus dulcis]